MYVVGFGSSLTPEDISVKRVSLPPKVIWARTDLEETSGQSQFVLHVDRLHIPAGLGALGNEAELKMLLRDIRT